MSEIRKNGERRRFQWWLLVLGFALGVLLMIGVQRASAPADLTGSPSEFQLTATQIIREATNASPEIITPGVGDGIFGTATQMVHEATETAVASTLTSP